MKIAVTARGAEATSEVDPRFGRARWFIVVDTDSGEVNAVDNSKGLDAAHGAGIQAAERVVREGANVVITGNCGPNAFDVLSAAGIKVVIGAGGTVSEAIEAFKQGQLKAAGTPNVAGHW